MPFVRVRVDGRSRKMSKSCWRMLREMDARFLKLVYSNERSIGPREQPNVVALVVALVSALVAALAATIAEP